MAFDEIENIEIFILQVAAIFEENCLHQIKTSTDIEKGMLLATNYCLDSFFK